MNLLECTPHCISNWRFSLRRGANTLNSALARAVTSRSVIHLRLTDPVWSVCGARLEISRKSLQVAPGACQYHHPVPDVCRMVSRARLRKTAQSASNCFKKLEEFRVSGNAHEMTRRTGSRSTTAPRPAFCQCPCRRSQRVACAFGIGCPDRGQGSRDPDPGNPLRCTTK